MNILFVTPRPPYPFLKGDRLRPYYLIKELSRSHSVDLCSFYANEHERQSLADLGQFCARIKAVPLPRIRSLANLALTFANLRPFQVNYFYSRVMKQTIRELLHEKAYDIVHIVLVRMLQYGDCVDHTPIVLDQIDALSLNMKRRAVLEANFFKKAVFFLEHLLVRSYEDKAKQHYAASTISSQPDRDYLNNPLLAVISNGVDPDYFCSENSEKSIDLIFTGNMGYFPNADAAVYLCDTVLPLILKKRPDISLYIVGANPSSKLRRIARRHQVVVTGFVDDIRPYLNQARVFVAPLRSGSGIQNKILEAMACALPVVSTSCGNAGIGGEQAKHLRIADSAEDIALEILSLLADQERRLALGNAARAFVREKFDWLSRGRQLEEVYRTVLKQSNESSRPHYARAG